MTLEQVVLQYEGRILELQTGLGQILRSQALAALLLTLAVAILLAFGIYAIRGQMSFLWPSLSVPVAAGSARRLRQTRQSESRLGRLEAFYERALRRVKGDWAGSGSTGAEFSDPVHVYAADLNILGEGSLFEMLCIARTSLGRRGLANYLLRTPGLDETLRRQQAVGELGPRTDLREKVATLGEFDFLESHPDTFDDWLSSPRLAFPRYLQIIAACTSALLAGLVIAGLLGIVPWSSVGIWIWPLVAFHAVMGLYFRASVNRMADAMRPLSFETRVLRDGVRLLETESFQSEKLGELAAQVQGSSAAIGQLQRLLHALELRTRDPWFYGPSLALLAGTQLCFAIERWRVKHGETLRGWVRAWSEFEALNCLAAYSYENPEYAFPSLDHGETCFEASELGHPLLARTTRVTNDVSLRRDCRFYVVSGSNMSGKSTLLRAIGLNAVLAFAGAPVPARSLRISGLSVYASISLTDSLLNGKSKFRAEVDRLRQALESAVPNRPVLFLVDEIFGGTNSRDRRIAAEAVVRTLIERGAIGALSTHDLALAEIACVDELCGANVHMSSRTPDDPMDFDYRLKPGVTTETNALTIARLAGVPV